MPSKALTLLLLAVMSVVVFSEIEMATICEKSDSCTSGYSYKICGRNGFYYSACSDACTNALVQSFYIRKCEIDYKMDSCSSGVCYYNRTVNRCYS